MNNHCSHYRLEDVSAPPVIPLGTFTAYSLLRNYNYFLSPQSPEYPCKYSVGRCVPKDCNNSNDHQHFRINESDGALDIHSSNRLLDMRYSHYKIGASDLHSESSTAICDSILGHPSYKRQRGEKKPIPENQKDDKYFEKRRRNNQAAKKSRDARKMREDQVALRAAMLEHENALLKAQVITLREEASSLRQLLLHKKAVELASNKGSAP